MNSFSEHFIIVNNLQEKSRRNILDHFTLPVSGYGHITPLVYLDKSSLFHTPLLVFL